MAKETPNIIYAAEMALCLKALTTKENYAELLQKQTDGAA